MRLFRLGLATALALGAASPAPSADKPSDGGSLALSSYARARSVLDRAVAAMGGERALREIGIVSRQMTVHYVDPGQQAQPTGEGADLDTLPVAARIETTIQVDHAGTRLLKVERFEDGPGDWFIRRDVGDAGGGFEVGQFREETPFFAAHSPEEAAALRRRELRLLPEALLRAALERPEALHWAGRSAEGGRPVDLLVFAEAEGSLSLLAFDAVTHLPVRAEAVRDHAVLGDTSAEISFSDYRRVGPLMLPFRTVTRIGGRPSRDHRIESITFGAAFDKALLRPPAEYLPILQPPSIPTLRDAGHGVYEILGPYNLIFAVFRDYVLLVEAPVDEGYAEACYRLIRSVAPGKPIRVVATHFHHDHIGGLRYAVAQGSPIWTTADARPVILEALRSARTLRPDAQSRSPRAPAINLVRDRAVFDDGTQRVEIHDFGPAPHVRQLLAAWFPRVKTLHVADLWDILNPELALGSVDAEVTMHRARALGLGFERFLPVHGVPATRRDLERGLAVRSRYVPPADMDAWRHR